jgi:hypothetical protein
VNIPLKLNQDPPYKNTLNQIAGVIHVDPGAIEDVLRTWTREQLREHLSQFTREQLKRPNLR